LPGRLTGAVFALVLVNLGAACAMNVWNRNIFDALEKKDAGAVVSLSGIYVVILVISVVFAVAQVYARICLHYGADRVQLVGRQLPQARRLDRLSAPYCIAHGVARRLGARRGRRGHRSHRAARRWQRRGDRAARPLGHPRRRHRGARRHRDRHQAGERVLVAGESGTGKSTLVRAIAGLWPWGGGKIDIKKGAKLMMLPQRPYIPIGTLRRAVTYPDAAEDHEIKEIADAFRLNAQRAIKMPSLILSFAGGSRRKCER
jgi:hypothetical protein